MFRDGFTHGDRFGRIPSCESSQGGHDDEIGADPRASFARRASSPSVMPYRIGTGMNPEKRRVRIASRARARSPALPRHRRDRDDRARSPVCRRALHRASAGRSSRLLGVVAGPDVLQVDQQHIHGIDRGARGGTRTAIETVDWRPVAESRPSGRPERSSLPRNPCSGLNKTGQPCAWRRTQEVHVTAAQ